MRAARSTATVTVLVVMAGASIAVLRVRAASAHASPVAWVANSNAPSPNEQTIGSVRHIETREAAQRLNPDSGPPLANARLLWLEGRATKSFGDSTFVVDNEGHLLSIDRRLQAHAREVAGAAGGWRAAVVGPAGDLWLTDRRGHIVRVDRRGVQHTFPTGPFDAPSLTPSTSANLMWLSRSTDQLTGAVDSVAGPLFVAVDSLGVVQRRVGQAHRPAHVLLEAMENAGHLATRDSTLYFAPFIRDQLVAIRQDGDTQWVASRGLAHSSGEPKFEVIDGKVVIDYHPVNLGLVWGPDGLLYVLSTSDGDMTGTRLDVFDPASGHLLRTAMLSSTNPTLAVDPRGRVHLLASSYVLGAGGRVRQKTPSIDLALLDGGRVKSDTLRGRIVLVNLWASWCGPCRAEMPALDSLQQRVAGRDVVFLSINEDAQASAARSFMSTGKFVFPVALGGALLHERFGAVGLPATILIDRDGREIRRWMGYSGPDQIAEIGRLIEAAQSGAMARPLPMGAIDHQHRQ